MIFSLQRFEVLDRKKIYVKTFNSEKTTFNLFSKRKRYAFEFSGYQWMKNAGFKHWVCLIKESILKNCKEWQINTEIELVSTAGVGYYGLAWGLKKNIKTINCFCLSADGRQCIMSSFSESMYLFSNRNQMVMETPLKGKIIFSILKTLDYYFFFLNKILVYVCSSQVFKNEGTFIGYYMDPHLFIRSPQLEVEQLVTRKAVATPMK